MQCVCVFAFTLICTFPPESRTQGVNCVVWEFQPHSMQSLTRRWKIPRQNSKTQNETTGKLDTGHNTRGKISPLPLFNKIRWRLTSGSYKTLQVSTFSSVFSLAFFLKLYYLFRAILHKPRQNNWNINPHRSPL